MNDTALGRIVGVFVSPTRTFRAIGERPNWLGPMLVIVVAGSVSALVLAPKIDWQDTIHTKLQRADREVTPEKMDTPTLFLHGNPDSADLWDGVTERLRGGFRCLAPDLPGFGRSGDAGDLDCSLAGFARLVDEIVREIGVNEPLNLVMHDLGGFVGLSWAVENPDRVRSLAIINTVYSSQYRWHFWGRVWRTPLLGEFSVAVMNWPLFRWEMRRGSRHLSDEQIRAAYRHVSPKTKRVVLKLYRATDPENFRGWEERLLALTGDVPTLVLWGDHDPYIAKRYAGLFGTRNVRHFPDHGHWLPAEAPAEVAEALAAHLA